MKVLYIGCMASPPGCDNGFTKAMKLVCDEYEEISVGEPNLNDRIQNTIGADLVFIQIQATGITKESIECLKALDCYIIEWSGDCRQPLPDHYIQTAQWGVDLTCFSNMEDVRTMRDLGFKSEFLQIGYAPDIYHPGEARHSHDIIFMGNNCGGFPLSHYRVQMVEFLKAHYGSRFGLYGSGWGGLEDGNYMGDQHGEAECYRGAKIGINLSHFDCERYTSDRMFRMLGCGVCVLSHKYKGIEEDFKRQIWKWDSFEEMRSLIDYLLNREAMRAEVSNLGHQLALTNYTFDSMANNIIKLWKNRE